jgi:hypothetical protein
MKRTMRFLARLYPSSWRKRYGVEFDALLDDAKPSMRDAFDVFCGALKMQMTTLGFGRITLACSVAGILVAAGISFALPVHYVSRTVLFVTPGDGLTSTGEPERRLVSNLARDVFSREYLASVIQEHNLYPRERARMSLNDVTDKMKRDITVEALPPVAPGNQDTVYFAVQFAYSDAQLAQQVNEGLIFRLLEGHLKSARQLNSSWTFRVYDPPDLRPAGPNRMQFATAGLLAGLLAGLTLAIVLKSRRTTTVGNG